MAPPQRHGSLANTVIWSCTLLAIAALTVWKFEIWPVIDFATQTGTIDSEQADSEDIPADPITIAKADESDESSTTIEQVDSRSDEAPPPPELAKLDIAGPLPPIPRSRNKDWNQDESPETDTPSRKRAAQGTQLPTGADFGGGGNFPQANSPPASEQRPAPIPTAAPDLQPIDPKSAAPSEKDAPSNPFLEQTGAVDKSLSKSPSDASKVARADFESPAEIEISGIDEKIAGGQMLAAHRDLSQLYWDRPNRRAEIQDRIDHTATSIYFDPTPHYMPSHTPHADESLAAIAKTYKITPEYLARLNDLDKAAGLSSEQSLKVVKGPFGAVIDPEEQSITIHAHGYYIRQLPCEISLKNSDGKSFRLHQEKENTLVLIAEKNTRDDNPFAANTANPSPAGTIRLKRPGAAVAQDLLAAGAPITIR